MFGSLQLLVVQVISYAAFAGGVWALIDISRRSPAAFASAGKQTKTLWLILAIVATAVLFVVLPFPLGNGGGALNGIIGLAAATVVIIYHVGVKPALGTHRREPKGGGRSTKGGW